MKMRSEILFFIALGNAIYLIRSRMGFQPRQGYVSLRDIQVSKIQRIRVMTSKRLLKGVSYLRSDLRENEDSLLDRCFERMFLTCHCERTKPIPFIIRCQRPFEIATSLTLLAMTARIDFFRKLEIERNIVFKIITSITEFCISESIRDEIFLMKGGDMGSSRAPRSSPSRARHVGGEDSRHLDHGPGAGNRRIHRIRAKIAEAELSSRPTQKEGKELDYLRRERDKRITSVHRRAGEESKVGVEACWARGAVPARITLKEGCRA